MEELPESSGPTATRKDLQLSRRLFHCVSGLSIALAYALLFSHSQIVHFLGIVACAAYIFDKARIAYPEIAVEFEWLSNFFLRAEERLKESSMIPYCMGILLTILSFPKPIALISICTLAIADPLSAIIGIQFGKHKWVEGKSIEGSAAFFTASFLISFIILRQASTNPSLIIILLSIFFALSLSLFEMIKFKIDDNLTIPIASGLLAWLLCGMMSIDFVTV